ncbi:hypothetical protein K4K60_000357 [Colletotrichum sp. SAR11_57]|nr:hypothetical protein K4K60_000357 [Colletotrichum sp. SAR11_57]
MIVDATNLNIPAKLGGSQYLQDLSRVSGADLVGQDATPATLQIFDVYYVTLLVGYWFDPRSDLKLDATSIAGSFSGNLNNALNSYAKTSSFFGVAYIFAFVLAILAPIVSVISGRCGRAGFAGVVLSAMATICLLAASIAATVIFKKVDDAIKENFNDIGISSALGLLFVPTWIAVAFSLLASVLMGIKTRNPRPPKGPTSGMITGGRDIKSGNVQGGVPRPLTLLKRVQTWGQHKYVNIGGGGGGGQFANTRGGDGEFDDDTALIGRRYSPELDPKQEQESTSIAMVPLDHKGSKDMNQAYESYTGRAL